MAFRPVVEATGNVAFNGDQSTQVLSPVSGPATRVLVDAGRGRDARRAARLRVVARLRDRRRRLSQGAVGVSKRKAHRRSRLGAVQERRAWREVSSEQAQADVAAADADLDAAMQNMRALGVEEAQIQAVREGSARRPIEAIIRAPIDGTVVEKLIADGQLLAGRHHGRASRRRSQHDVGHGQRVRERPARRRGRPDRPTSSRDASPRRRSRAASITSRRSPIPARRRCRCASWRRTTITCSGATCSCASRSSRGTSTAGLLVPVSSVLRDDQNLPFVFVIAAERNAFARRRIDARNARRRHVRSHRRASTAGDQVVADGALFLQFAESQ